MVPLVPFKSKPINVVRVALADLSTFTIVATRWFDKHEIPEGKLFQIMPQPGR